MGAVHLGVVATYLSDPLISGFTTGSAVLVVISQMKHILGVKVPQFAKPFVAPKVRLEVVLTLLTRDRKLDAFLVKRFITSMIRRGPTTTLELNKHPLFQ